MAAPIDQDTLCLLDNTLHRFDFCYEPERWEDGEHIFCVEGCEEIRQLTGATLVLEPGNKKMAAMDAFLGEIVSEQDDWYLDCFVTWYEEFGAVVSLLANRSPYNALTRLILTEESLGIIDEFYARLAQSA